MVAKATLHTNWVIYFIGLYLAKNYDTALEVFDNIIQQWQEDNNILKLYELNELYLFKCRILQEQGEIKKAIKFMTKKQSRTRNIAVRRMFN